MPQYQGVTTLFADISSKGTDDRSIIPACLVVTIPFAAGFLQTLPDPPHKSAGCKPADQWGKPVAQRQMQQTVAPVSWIDQISVTEIDPSAVKLHNNRAAMQFGANLCSKSGSQVKIVISFQVDQPDTAAGQSGKRCKQRFLLRKIQGRQTDTEVKKVAKDTDEINLIPLFFKKTEQQSVIGIIGMMKMGIS